MTEDRIGMMQLMTPGLMRMSTPVIADTDSDARFVLYLKDVEKPFFLDLHESVRDSSPRRRPRT